MHVIVHWRHEQQVREDDLYGCSFDVCFLANCSTFPSKQWRASATWVWWIRVLYLGQLLEASHHMSARHTMSRGSDLQLQVPEQDGWRGVQPSLWTDVWIQQYQIQKLNAVHERSRLLSKGASGRKLLGQRHGRNTEFHWYGSSEGKVVDLARAELRPEGLA